MRFERSRFVWITAIVVAVLSVVPFLVALSIAPNGTRYIGFQYNTDDHMVYAAWMRQAMEGHFLFDNRFAVDPQPSLTIHVYFWALGVLAKAVGIPWACAIGRFLFGGLFVLILARFLRLASPNRSFQKVALILVCFGAGIGYLAWQNLGQDFFSRSQSPLKDLLLGHLPNDVWQPEAFVFPSLLTNSLFSVSLCLIVGIFYCVLRSRDSWRPVPLGAIGMLVLMNIHSYDVLLLTLVLIGLLVATIVRKQLTAQWLLRVVCIGIGAIPSALWFVYVLRHDPVFQSRAATLTYTENFRSIAGGYILMMILGLGGAVVWTTRRTSIAGAGLLIALLGLGFLVRTGDYWLGAAGMFALMFACVLMIVALAWGAIRTINSSPAGAPSGGETGRGSRYSAIATALTPPTPPVRQAKTAFGMVALALLLVGFFIAASGHTGGYWMDTGAWIALYAAGLVVVGLLARTNPAVSLVIAWAVIGFIAPYFPGLFERKLMMGLSIPWAILAAGGILFLTKGVKSQERRLIAALSLILVSGSSVRWLGREFSLILTNDSNTTVQTVFLNSDQTRILDYLNEHQTGQRIVVLAMPGIPASTEQLYAPIYPDLNPVFSGLTGVYTYAGHWSETPDYGHRRNLATEFFIRMTPSERSDLVNEIRCDYIVAPVPEYLATKIKEPIADVRKMGEVVVDGQQMRLIRLRH